MRGGVKDRLELFWKFIRFGREMRPLYFLPLRKEQQAEERAGRAEEGNQWERRVSLQKTRGSPVEGWSPKKRPWNPFYTWWWNHVEWSHFHAPLLPPAYFFSQAVQIFLPQHRNEPSPPPWQALLQPSPLETIPHSSKWWFQMSIWTYTVRFKFSQIANMESPLLRDSNLIFLETSGPESIWQGKNIAWPYFNFFLHLRHWAGIWNLHLNYTLGGFAQCTLGNFSI